MYALSYSHTRRVYRVGSRQLCLQIVLSLFFFFGFSFISFSQYVDANPDCVSAAGERSNPAATCGDDCLSNMENEDILKLPLITINLDFHFVRSNGNNFHCDPNGDPQYYAPTYVAQILDRANLFFSEPEENQFGGSPKVPDARIRYQLVGNPTDPCDAIFIVNSDPLSNTLNPNALHIIVKDVGAIGVSGAQSGNIIWLYQIHQVVFDNDPNNNDAGPWGPLMNHEFGHRCGLCHAFSTYNTCPDMDPGAECGGPATGGYPLSCGSNQDFSLYCTWGTGNNFMGYNGSLRGMTRSQFAQMYSAMVEERPLFASFEQLSCLAQVAQPLEIFGTVDWNTLKIMDRYIEVRPGATLIIRCEVRMPQDAPIIVNRGARLWVLGGKVTSLDNSCTWPGILVHGNAGLGQPTSAQVKDPDNPLPNSMSAGAVWLNGAILANAITAISTKASGSLDNSQYYGGLIIGENSDFWDNDRAVEFMKYEKPNNSIFSYCEIGRAGANPPLPAMRGVSIWACRGIKFFETHFSKLGDSGISGLNYSVSVNQCSFKGCKYGFKADATQPNTALSTTEIKKSQFELNQYDIYTNASPNMIYGYNIEGNVFLNGTGTDFGIRIIGESAYLIQNENIFDGKLISTYLGSTGPYFNKVRCNIYETYTQGINAYASNSNLEIIGNDFYGASGSEIAVTGTTTQKGTIRSIQGNPNGAASNCFSNPASAIAANTNLTNKFKYYVPDPQSTSCYRPTNNQSDGGSNNYTWGDANDQLLECAAPPGGMPPVTESDLEDARDDTSIKLAQWQADSGNEALEVAYLDAARHQNYCLTTLVQEAFDNEELDAAENFLLGEDVNWARRGVVGLRVYRKNFFGAQALLDAMPVENQDDQWFKDIMAINLALETSEYGYSPTEQQIDFLETVSSTQHSLMRGYACALLSLFTGYTCEETIAPVAEEGGMVPPVENTHSESLSDEIRIYPNPNSGTMWIHCSSALNEEIYYEFSDFSGRAVQSGRYMNMGNFQIEANNGLPQGIYRLRLLHKDSVLYTSRVVVIR